MHAMVPWPEPLLPGALLAGRYRLQRLLASLPYARRYLAEDAHDGALLVIQEIVGGPFAGHEDRQQAAAWLEGQVAVLQRLQHQGLPVVRAQWVGPGPGQPFYVVHDYVPGLTLAEELEEADGAVPWRQALDWGIALCGNLAYLHGQGYVYGELRPHHVVLDARSAMPVLTEFGLARKLTAGAGDEWGYVPFEQYIGRAEPRSDLYALGALLRTLLTGQDPTLALAQLRRQGQDVQRALRALFSPLTAPVATIPTQLSAVLARATAFSVDDRFPDAPAMLQALSKVRGPEIVSEPIEVETDDKVQIWTRLGFRRAAWFALPATERNRHLLALAGSTTRHPPAPPPAAHQPPEDASLRLASSTNPPEEEGSG